MPELSVDDINKAVKDSAYAAVGFGILGFQRAQVRRRELNEQLAPACRGLLDGAQRLAAAAGLRS